MFARFKKFIIAYLIFKIIFICGLIYSYHNAFLKPHVAQEVVVIIPKNTSISEISELLYKQKVIKDRFLFSLISKILTFNKEYLKSGEYKFEVHMKMIEVINKLLKGDIIIHKLTIPEGYTNSEIFVLLDCSYGLSGDIDRNMYKEGYLLPETYSYKYGDSKQSILSRMHLGMKKALDKFLATAPLPIPIKNTNELLTLASIVEKETRIASERPRIAGVYLNRLRTNMPLQADPTVIYGITLGSAYSEQAIEVILDTEEVPPQLPTKSELCKKSKPNTIQQVTYKDLESDSPYNTYKFSGLPPTPIANPGLSSIMAVLSPMKTDELFFVADGSGGHKFAITYENHLNNVKNFRSYIAQKAQEKVGNSH